MCFLSVCYMSDSEKEGYLLWFKIPWVNISPCRPLGACGLCPSYPVMFWIQHSILHLLLWSLSSYLSSTFSFFLHMQKYQVHLEVLPWHDLMKGVCSGGISVDWNTVLLLSTGADQWLQWTLTYPEAMWFPSVFVCKSGQGRSVTNFYTSWQQDVLNNLQGLKTLVSTRPACCPAVEWTVNWPHENMCWD